MIYQPADAFYDDQAKSLLFVILSLYAARITKYGRPSKTVQYQSNKHNNNFCNCTYSSGKDDNIRKNLEEIIRVLLQDSSAARMEAEYDINSDIRDTADEIILQLSIKTKEMAKKIDFAIKEKNLLELIENINNRLAALEHASDSSSNHELEPVSNNVTESGSGTSNAVNMCNISVPASVQINKDIWKKLETPLQDDLDRFMINKTGTYVFLICF